MGTWGAALYDDDEAADLKNAIALISKVPGDGDRLLEILERQQEATATDGLDGPFWLVVADQFERRGIACARATETALRIIDAGTDLAACRDRGADDSFLRARAKVLDELAARLRAPRPAKPRRGAGKPPPLVLATGEIYSFRTMAGRAWHPYRLDSAGPFVPDGWGALIVLDTGRAFDWLPWVALAALDVRPDEPPTLAEAIHGRLIFHPQTHGAGRFVPKPAHAKGLGLQLLGQVELDAGRVAPLLSKWPISQAIQFDWTIAYGALSGQAAGGLDRAGPTLASVCRATA